MLVRIDKLLAANGFGSRKEVRRLLRKEDFCVNGRKVTDVGTLLNPDSDCISRNGSPVAIRCGCYLMLNKPAGVVTSAAPHCHGLIAVAVFKDEALPHRPA